MPKFITLHECVLGRDVYVNPEYIECIKSYGNRTRVILTSSYEEVKESLEEVMSIIKDINIESNCL